VAFGEAALGGICRPGVAGGLVLVVGEDDVPPVEAELAAIDDDLAGLEPAPLLGLGDEVAGAAAVDAVNGGAGVHIVDRTPPVRSTS
jgi:hypothetical protein